MKITLHCKYTSGICRYLFNLHLWYHVTEQAHACGIDIQKSPTGESEDFNVILKRCKFIKPDHHFMVKTDYLHDYFLLQWFSAGGNFAPQGTFGNVKKYF